MAVIETADLQRMAEYAYRLDGVLLSIAPEGLRIDAHHGNAEVEFSISWPDLGQLRYPVNVVNAQVDRLYKLVRAAGPAGGHGQVGWMGGEFDR